MKKVCNSVSLLLFLISSSSAQSLSINKGSQLTYGFRGSDETTYNITLTVLNASPLSIEYSYKAEGKKVGGQFNNITSERKLEPFYKMDEGYTGNPSLIINPDFYRAIESLESEGQSVMDGEDSSMVTMPVKGRNTIFGDISRMEDYDDYIINGESGKRVGYWSIIGTYLPEDEEESGVSLEYLYCEGFPLILAFSWDDNSVFLKEMKNVDYSEH